MIQVKSEEEIRAKVTQTLSDALPYKQTLSLRLLITYCIDGGAMQSCVIDEILSRNNGSTPVRDGPQRPMDLSTPKSASPSSQMNDIPDKPVLNPLNKINEQYNKQQPAILEQMKNILNNPLTNNFLDKDNPLLTNNPFLPLFPAKPLLDNDLIQNLIKKLNNGKEYNFNPNPPGNLNFPNIFSQEKPKKNIRKDNNLISGVKAEKKMRYNRNFNCNQCKANFNSLADLNRHTVETHSTFKCTICSASFTQRSNLQRHSLKHVGFKPFTCALCKKEYYRKDHLMRHIEVTHPHVDPKSSIITHLTSSECLEYLEKMNLSHSLGNNNNDTKINQTLLNDQLNKPITNQQIQERSIEDGKLLESNNDSNNNTKSQNIFNKIVENDIKTNKSNNNFNFMNTIKSQDMPKEDNNDVKKFQENSSYQLDDPEDLEDDEDLHNDESDYEREECGQVNIDFSDESHLMQQTLNRSFKQADTQRQDERMLFINESIYDSGEIYKGDQSDDEVYECDPNESEAAVATLQMNDDDVQMSGEIPLDEHSSSIGINMEFDEKATSELNVK